MQPISQRYCIALLPMIIAANCHTVITYPGWRGNNLGLNGTVEETNGLGVGLSNDLTTVYPYGMQWIYPCGGLPVAENRTKWPINGGAVSFQPGWYTGHKTALIYVNIGFGSIPPNYSFPLVPRFEIIGPTDNPYPDSICLPQVSLPEGLKANVGDLATIQVVEAAKHGAAMYSCVDIILADLADVEKPNETNCFNSTTISVASGDARSPTVSSGTNRGSTTSTQSIAAISSATPTLTNGAADTRVGRTFEASLIMAFVMMFR
ncbi:hypothetical protein F5B20DRAFT_518821 [Whalleya microplaca]|nr:hypothetical protein F5B20DRAFT_518821 [Whalleya microplaca]